MITIPMDYIPIGLIILITPLMSLWIQPTCIKSNHVTCCIPQGSDLAINCSHNPEWLPEATSANISLTKRHLGSPTSRTIHESTDGTEGFVFLISNVSKADSGVYCCCIDDHDTTCTDDRCTALSYKVGVPPSRPEGFGCMIYNFSSMECTWTSTEEYCVSWTVTYTPFQEHRYGVINYTVCHPNATTVLGDCGSNYSCTSENEITCIRSVWKLQTPQLDVTYNFTLTGNGPYGTSSYNFSVSSSYKIRKLDELSGCKPTFNGSTTTVCCSFPLPPAAFDYGITCNITATSEYSSRFYSTSYMGSKTEFCYQLENTYPYTTYSVLLVCQVSGSQYWANPHQYSFTTPEDVPLVGPSSSNQSYTVWCTAGKLHTLVYIQPPSANLTQGKLTGYYMQVDSVVHSFNQTFIGNKTTLSFSEKVSTCGISVHYGVVIWTRTVKGNSKSGTYLSITANLTNVPIAEVIIEERSSGYLVSWKGVAGHPSDCVYHWCLADPISSPENNLICMGGYNFTESNRTQLLIPLETTTGLSWHFGVSQKHTGIRWQDCVFSDGPAAEQPERLVFIDESSTELSPLPFCSATSRQGPRPSSYLVVWSNLNTSTASNITIPARLKTTFSARDLGLHAETNYSVKYKIFYSMGEESDYSDEIYIDIPVAESRRLQSNAESTRNNWNTVATVMGVVVLGLTILIILVYKARRKWIKIDDNIESVTIPRPVSNEQFYQEQNTPPLLNQPPDSGHGTLSSVPTQETVPPTTHLPDIPSNDMSNESQNYLEERDWDELHGENVSLSAAGALPSNDECSVNIVNKSEVALVFSKKPTTDYIQVGNRGISNDVSDESQNYLKERDGDGDELHGENVSVSAAGALPSTDECNVNIVNKSEVAVVFSKKPTTDYIQVGNRSITMPTLVVSNPDYTQNTTDDAFPNSTILSLESFVNNHDTFDDRNYQSSMQTYVQCFVNYQHTTELNDPNVMPQNICINARSDTFSDTLDACKTICSDQTLTNSCQNQQNSEIDTSSLIKGEETQTTYHSTHQVTHDTSSLIKGEETENTCHSTHQLTYDTSSLIKGEETQTTYHSTHQLTYDTSPLNKEEETENTCHSTHQLTCDTSAPNKGEETQTTYNSTHQVTHDTSSSLIKGEEIETTCHSTHQVTHDTSSSLIKGEEIETTCHSTHQVTHDTSSSLIKGEEIETTCHSTHQVTHDTSSLIKGEETENTCHSTHQLTYDISSTTKGKKTETTCHSTHQVTHENFVHDDYVLASFIESQHSSNPNN